MPAAELRWEQALGWRMRRHGLVERESGDVVEVARRLCGVHAQVQSSAELTAWARMDGLVSGDVAAAVADGRLVKTWAVRGTLRLIETVGEALDGRSLTREELAADVASRLGDPSLVERLTESWGATLKPAALRGTLAFAPSTGRETRFTRPPSDSRPPVDDAVREVTRRYLAAYGPARREDYSRWWGGNALSPAKAQKRFEALGDEVAQVSVGGDRCWVLATDLDALLAADAPSSARLLPGFDQYVVSSGRDIEALLPAASKERVHRPQGWISPVVLVDGAIAGVWRQDGSIVEAEPFGDLPAWAAPQLEAERDRLSAFQETAVMLRGLPG